MNKINRNSSIDRRRTVYSKSKVKRFRSKFRRMNRVLLKSKNVKIINGYQPSIEGDSPVNRPKPPGNE